jgi:hypothetical protein
MIIKSLAHAADFTAEDPSCLEDEEILNGPGT